MSNIVTKFLNSRSKTEFTNAHLLNNIRKHASDSYKADIPNISGAINHDNVPYQQFEIHQNEFFKGLIDRIGSTVIKALQYENALGIFKSELFEFGDTLQEIYVAPAERETYNGKDPISPYKFADTDIEVFYHYKFMSHQQNVKLIMVKTLSVLINLLTLILRYFITP